MNTVDKRGEGSAAPSYELLRRHVENVPLAVAVTPGTGLNIHSDWWDARIEDIGISHCDYGLDKAVSGLAMRVRNALEDGALDDCGQRNSALALRLHLARLDGDLMEILHDSTVIAGDFGIDS